MADEETRTKGGAIESQVSCQLMNLSIQINWRKKKEVKQIN